MKSGLKKNMPYHLMLLPCVVFLLIFAYTPMAGIVIAFQKFIPAKGLFGSQEWVGLYQFQYTFQLPGFWSAFRNTLYISFMKIVAGTITPIVFAILINEVRKAFLRRSIQTVVYLPHFLSWVILAGVFIDILSPSQGIVNQFIKFLGFEPIFFMGSNAIFPYLLVVTDVWKGFGFGTIVFLAAIVSINPNLYEAAIVDGANKWKQIWHITIPGMTPIILLITLLNMAGLFDANFDQVFNMYSPQVYPSGDIIDTLVYRIGFLEANFSLSAAIGLFRSVVSCILVGIFYYLAYRISDYRIF